MISWLVGFIKKVSNIESVVVQVAAGQIWLCARVLAMPSSAPSSLFIIDEGH